LPPAAQRIPDWNKKKPTVPQLEPYAADPEFGADWRTVQHATKVRLANYIRQSTGVLVDPASMFDVQVKRIHEYKHQHLNVLHIAALYFQLKRDSSLQIPPRTFLFGGKAAPG